MLTGKCINCKKKFRKRERKNKFCSLICANNFNRNGLKYVKLPAYSNLLAEFVGICLGDGNVAKYQVGITLNTIADKKYIPYVLNVIKLLFPSTKISLSEKKNQNAIYIRINSKIVASFIYGMGIIPKDKKIPDWILTSDDYRHFCARGLFDTEGSISFKIYKSKKGTSLYKQLNFRNTNIRLIRFMRDTLKDMGLRPTMTLEKSLYLSNHESIEYFNNKVGFGNPKLTERSDIFTIEDYLKWKTQQNGRRRQDSNLREPLTAQGFSKPSR
jgi:hypothetical protein